MKTRVGINGFGRIGRQVLKAIHEQHAEILEVVVVNDLTDPKTNAHLFKYDSNYGIFPGKVSAGEDFITINGGKIYVLAEREPSKIPWRNYQVDIVVESSGRFTDAAKARGHLEGGARKVIISAPARNEDITVVLGVNEGQYDPRDHHIISNASCTTNCIAPVVKVLHDKFGVTKGLMTTVHSYTNDQRILDQVHDDLRRARAAALSIIPTTTGAAKAVTQVIPELKGLIHGMAFRVPTATVSVCDFVGELRQPATIKEINNAYKEAARGSLTGILEFCDEELVSIDFKSNPASAIVDGPSTMVIGNNLVKVIAWYDNEWGYACRTADLAAYIAKAGW